MIRIEKHNGESHTWKMGITKFADLTREEFKRTHLQGYKPFGTKRPTMGRKEKINIQDLPESVDWRDQGIITEVRDQVRNKLCEMHVRVIFLITIHIYSAATVWSIFSKEMCH